MKKLSKEQLENLVYEKTRESFETNRNNVIKNVTDSIEEGDNCSNAIIKAMMALYAEIINMFDWILIETLNDIICEEEEG